MQDYQICESLPHYKNCIIGSLKYQIIRLKQPTESEARQLSRISKASKAHWGYPAEWLELWREDLEVDPDYLARHTTFVLQLLPGRKTAGFCVVSEEPPHLWIEHLWVLPEYIGSGYGSALLNEAVSVGEKAVFRSCKVIADPFAAGFYAGKGFVTIGHHPSKPGDRQLPIMERPVRPKP